MKILSLVAVAIITIAGSNALACAMCADIYSEVVVLDAGATKQLRSNANLAKGEVFNLSSVTCVKANRYAGLKEVPTCTLTASLGVNPSVDLSLNGEAAIGLHSQLMNLTVEPQVVGEDEDTLVRSGERSSPVMISQSLERTSATLTNIHTGTLSCPKVRGTARCEIELLVLNALNFGD